MAGKLTTKHLLRCRKCGSVDFQRIQTGYNTLVTCQVLKSGKIGVVYPETEELDEVNDGGSWSRLIVCIKCGTELMDEDVQVTEDDDQMISTIAFSDLESLSDEEIEAHGKVEAE